VSQVYGLIRAGQPSRSDADLALDSVFLAAFVYAERRVAHPMPDRSLLPVATSGGATAARTMNGSAYALLLHMVLHLQILPA